MLWGAHRSEQTAALVPRAAQAPGSRGPPVDGLETRNQHRRQARIAGDGAPAGRPLHPLLRADPRRARIVSLHLAGGARSRAPDPVLLRAQRRRARRADLNGRVRLRRRRLAARLPPADRGGGRHRCPGSHRRPQPSTGAAVGAGVERRVRAASRRPVRRGAARCERGRGGAGRGDRAQRRSAELPQRDGAGQAARRHRGDGGERLRRASAHGPRGTAGRPDGRSRESFAGRSIPPTRTRRRRSRSAGA